ncbi:MAG: hypothetical protein QME06_08215 [Desulfobacterales bacterium]|nr:hypothetical protein [Desulfobacterales bacterium]
MEGVLKNKETEKWVKIWKRAGIALDEIKRRELCAYDYDKNRKIVDEMLQWAHDHRKIRLTSGLVEQQRLFMKIKNRRIQL